MERWYVIHSKPRNEDLLCQQLSSRAVQVYCPCIKVQPVKSRARKMKPYFPSYLFAHVDLETTGFSALQWIPGAVGMVSFGGEPAWVSDSILQAIQERVDQVNAAGVEALRTLKTGDDVTIHSGPFAGYRGIFGSYLSDRERAIIFLKFIRDQQIRVDLPVSQISVIKQRPGLAFR